MNTVYRNIKGGDKKALLRLVCEGWNYDGHMQNPRLLKHFLNYTLLVDLRHCDYARVAVTQGRLSGLLFGWCRFCSHRAAWLSFTPSFLYSRLYLAFTKEGRKRMAVTRAIGEADRLLIAGREKDFHGELALLAVGKAFRDLGIGTKLQEDFKEYMRGKRAGNFYVYTDSHSNYRFYETHGFQRAGKREVFYPLPARPGSKGEYFLYDTYYRINFPFYPSFIF